MIIVLKIDSLKHRLIQVRKELEKIRPGYEDLVPSPDEITVNKFSKNGVFNTDTCAAAQKLRRILVEEVPGTYNFDCMHRLRNVWFGGMEKALTKRLNEILKQSVEEINPQLRVSASISAVIRAIDKEFSLLANYPKGY